MINETGKFLAYVLRHNPSAAGVTLDAFGWAQTEELINGINRSGRKIDLETLKNIVETDGKGRFSFSDDMTKIRANQGHSVAVNVEMRQCVPPTELYHGTAEDKLLSIKTQGILKKARNFVHLSWNAETAFKVGARHGNPIVLVIDTQKMYRDGFKFYLSANNVWQSADIPPEYIKSVITR